MVIEPPMSLRARAGCARPMAIASVICPSCAIAAATTWAARSAA
ncbi:MAG: hypothetical protein U1E25_08060 [Methylocystis sp.]